MPVEHKLLLRISAIIEPDETGFHGYCPALKGLHVDGRTEEETFSNLVEAIGVYLASLEQHREPLPIGPELATHGEEPPPAPRAGSVRSLTLEWPSLQMSGVS